jgi:hypothetical protein
MKISVGGLEQPIALCWDGDTNNQQKVFEIRLLAALALYVVLVKKQFASVMLSETSTGPNTISVAELCRRYSFRFHGRFPLKVFYEEPSSDGAQLLVEFGTEINKSLIQVANKKEADIVIDRSGKDFGSLSWLAFRLLVNNVFGKNVVFSDLPRPEMSAIRETCRKRPQFARDKNVADIIVTEHKHLYESQNKRQFTQVVNLVEFKNTCKKIVNFEHVKKVDFDREKFGKLFHVKYRTGSLAEADIVVVSEGAIVNDLKLSAKVVLVSDFIRKLRARKVSTKHIQPTTSSVKLPEQKTVFFAQQNDVANSYVFVRFFKQTKDVTAADVIVTDSGVLENPNGAEVFDTAAFQAFLDELPVEKHKVVFHSKVDAAKILRQYKNRIVKTDNLQETDFLVLANYNNEKMYRDKNLVKKETRILSLQDFTTMLQSESFCHQLKNTLTGPKCKAFVE